MSGRDLSRLSEHFDERFALVVLWRLHLDKPRPDTDCRLGFARRGVLPENKKLTATRSLKRFEMAWNNAMHKIRRFDERSANQPV